MILDKAKMAHDWYMKHSESPSFMDTEIKMAWQYVDAMQAEADKREKEESKNSREVRQKFINTFEKHELCCSEEWQPDWSQAPDNMTHFAVDENGSGWFFNREPHTESDCCWYCGDDSTELNNHNYQGNWQESLRKRP